MSDFNKIFLAEGGKKSRGLKVPQIYLAGFGKHPGWDDHIEDIGLETESLIIAKKLLYLDGIGGQIDAGAWEKLAPDQQIPLFDHVFVWKRDDQFIMGRLWSSKDGKGRARYPMIACAQCVGISLSWAVEHLLPQLEDIKRSCLETTSANKVESIFQQNLSYLRRKIETLVSETSTTGFTIEGRKQFISLPVFGADQEGLFRILYQLRSHIPACNGEKPERKFEVAAARAEQIRLPRGIASVQESILPWISFISSQIGSSIPQLLLIPCEGDWIDLIIGEASSSEFFCLRASPKSVSPASDVPYNLDADFRTKAKGLIASFLRGSAQHTQSKEENATPSTAGSKSGVRIVVFLLITLVAGYGGYRFLFQEKLDSKDSTRSDVHRDDTPKVIRKNTDKSSSGNTAKPIQENKPAKSISILGTDPEVLQPLMEPEVSKVVKKPIIEETTKQPLPVAKPRNEIQGDNDEPSVSKSSIDDVAQNPILPPAHDDLEVIKSKPRPEISEPDVKSKDDAGSVSGSELSKKIEVKPVETETTPVTIGDLFTNTIGMKLVKVPAGYWVGQFEVTQSEYEQVIGMNPSEFKGPRHPVETVNWDEAVEFCKKLSALEHEREVIPLDYQYVLPTESQWEYFAEGAKFLEAVTSRGGTRQRSTSPVGSTKISNKYQLYDVVGNVWEWCADSLASDRILKGGAYNSQSSLNFRPLSETTPWKRWRGLRDNSVGFRCLLVQK